MQTLFVALLLAVVGASTTAFVTPRTHRSSVAISRSAQPKTDHSDFPPEENSDEYTGSVDWDAEWKKVVASDVARKNIERPGKDFYKSDAEIAAIRAANKATEQAATVGSKIREITPNINIRSLSGDWKFWIGILAVISVGISVLSAPSGMTPQVLPSGGDSYYI